MPKKAKPLVHFDYEFYASHRLFRDYPFENGLPSYRSKHYDQWILSLSRQLQSEFYKKFVYPFSDTSDINLLQSLQEKHGLFSEKFFHRSIRSRIANNFAEKNIDLQEFQKTLSEANGYLYHLYDKSDAIFNIVNHIFKLTLFKINSELDYYRQLETWVEKFDIHKTCILCGNKFSVTDLPDWIYFGSNGFKGCCFHCNILESPKKRELFQLIPAFVESCGFTPNSSINPINFAFTSRLSDEQWAKVFLGYAKIGSVEHVKKKFGSWFHALVETGTLIDDVQPTARGIRCLAKDGHLCYSLDEQRIDDWLYIHNIQHEREPFYPFHSTLNSLGKKRADWKVKNFFIEYFGLIGHTNYERRMDEKILLAQNSNICLIEIYPSDIDKLDQLLGNLVNS